MISIGIIYLIGMLWGFVYIYKTNEQMLDRFLFSVLAGMMWPLILITRMKE